MTLPACDFCGTDEVEWVYPLKPGTDAIIVHEKTLPSGVIIAHVDDSNVTGSWKACEACHVLVDNGEWESLYQRTIDQIRLQYPQLRLNYNVRSIIYELITMFSECKAGVRFRFG